MLELRNCIANTLAPATSGATLPVIDPATGEHYATAPASEAADVARAVDAARDAFPGWAATPAAERAACMNRLADAIERDLERFARAESIDSGKPVSLARSVDIPRAVSNLRFFARAIQHGEGAFHDTDGQAINYTLRTPRGVAGCISPWNLPLYLFTWKVAPALATGNTVVAKPSEVTPVTAYMLSALIAEAGFPPGVFNVVHGLGDPAGAAIIEHPDVPAISFTGSTRVGEWIARTAGPTFKRLSLELGGKNPFIVMDDADLDAAIPTCVRAAFSNQGQICLCGSRILVHEAVAESFTEGIVAGAKALRIGDPLDDATQMGSLVSQDHRNKVAHYADRARKLGGEILTGGAAVDPADLPERCAHGAFFQPTLIRGLANDCDVIQDEIFGPIATIQTFTDAEEAIALANSTPYGLAASIWTRDVSMAHHLAARVQSGIIWVNCWMLRDLRTPFGGMKQSGVGREGGWDALKFFTEPKNVCVQL